MKKMEFIKAGKIKPLEIKPDKVIKTAIGVGVSLAVLGAVTKIINPNP